MGAATVRPPVLTRHSSWPVLASRARRSRSDFRTQLRLLYSAIHLYSSLNCDIPIAPRQSTDSKRERRPESWHYQRTERIHPRTVYLRGTHHAAYKKSLPNPEPEHT